MNCVQCHQPGGSGAQSWMRARGSLWTKRTSSTASLLMSAPTRQTNWSYLVTLGIRSFCNEF